MLRCDEIGEEDCFIVYPDPDELVKRTMREGRIASGIKAVVF